MWEHHHGIGFFHFSIFFLVLATFIVIKLIRHRRFGSYSPPQVWGSHSPGPSRHNCMDNSPYEAEAIIRKRLASGEIEEEEYLRLKDILSKY